MSDFNSPEAKEERQRVFREGQIDGAAPNPYPAGNWRHGTWNKGKLSAEQYSARQATREAEAQARVQAVAEHCAEVQDFVLALARAHGSKITANDASFLAQLLVSVSPTWRPYA